jgi:hypothetical protein
MVVLYAFRAVEHVDIVNICLWKTYTFVMKPFITFGAVYHGSGLPIVAETKAIGRIHGVVTK